MTAGGGEQRQRPLALWEGAPLPGRCEAESAVHTPATPALCPHSHRTLFPGYSRTIPRSLITLYVDLLSHSPHALLPHFLHASLPHPLYPLPSFPITLTTHPLTHSHQASYCTYLIFPSIPVNTLLIHFHNTFPMPPTHSPSSLITLFPRPLTHSP